MKAPAAPGDAGAGGGPGGRLPARLRSALALLGGDGRRRSKAAAALGLAGERVALAEGPHLLAEAVGAGVRVACVVTTARARAGEAGRHVAALEAAGVPAYVVSEGEFARLAATRAPQGVLAAVVLPRAWTSADLARGWRGGGHALALALAGVQDPGNAGSLARTALAAGAFALALDPAGARADDPKAVRASQGALFRLPVARLGAAEAVAAARGAGARVAA
ncbi:MAG: hypothetical protein K6V73_07115, partial [Firmicutes bacterium]|nr:hypothetical protein [Bacillota bacterium]